MMAEIEGTDIAIERLKVSRLCKTLMVDGRNVDKVNELHLELK